MKNKNKSRIVFDNRYYRLKFLTHDLSFLNAVREIKQNFAKAGWPIPDNGFNSLDEFYEWRLKMTKRRVALLKDGKELYSPKEAVEELLKKFQLNNDFYFPVWGYIYFCFQSFSRPPFEIITKSNKKSKELEVYIKIFSHTRKKDFINNWAPIKKVQEQLQSNDLKNREKEFEKYLKVYQDYLEIKRMPMKQRKRKYHIGGIYDIVGWLNDLSYERVKEILKQVKAASRS